MSTVTDEPLGSAPGTIDVSQTARVPFSRLIKVETRKMLDTRSGFWLLLSTALLLVIAVAIVILVIALNDDVTISLENATVDILLIPLSLLLPVFAIQAVTSEWSQRTALTTFTLEAHRARLIIAKLVAVSIMALGALLLAFILGVVLTAVAAGIGGYSADYGIGVETVVTGVVTQMLYFLMAFGIGMVVLNTPAAVALFYVVAMMLPFMVYGTLMAFFEWARDLIPWIDLQYASFPFFDSWSSLEGLDVARLVVASTIWIVIPLVLGFKRVLNTEPK